MARTPWDQADLRPESTTSSETVWDHRTIFVISPGCASPVVPTRGAGPSGGDHADPVSENLFRRLGRQWLIRSGGRERVVPHLIGYEHLAALLDRPRHDFVAADLPRAEARRRGDAVYSALGGPALSAEGLRIRACPDAPLEGPDRQALMDYYRQLQENAVQLEEARENYDQALVAELEKEREALLAEVSAATGRGVHGREQALIERRGAGRVAKAIERALTDLEGEHPKLAAHIRASLRRRDGRFSYEPDPPVRWVVEL